MRRKRLPEHDRQRRRLVSSLSPGTLVIVKRAFSTKRGVDIDERSTFLIISTSIALLYAYSTRVVCDYTAINSCGVFFDGAFDVNCLDYYVEIAQEPE